MGTINGMWTIPQESNVCKHCSSGSYQKGFSVCLLQGVTGKCRHHPCQNWKEMWIWYKCPITCFWKFYHIVLQCVITWSGSFKLGVNLWNRVIHNCPELPISVHQFSVLSQRKYESVRDHTNCAILITCLLKCFPHSLLARWEIGQGSLLWLCISLSFVFHLTSPLDCPVLLTASVSFCNLTHSKDVNANHSISLAIYSYLSVFLTLNSFIWKWIGTHQPRVHISLYCWLEAAQSIASIKHVRPIEEQQKQDNELKEQMNYEMSVFEVNRVVIIEVK